MSEPKQIPAFQSLTPDTMLDAVESIGYRTDGRFLALNSYENRVYQIGLEEAEPIIAKFYRPNRWTDAAILEEHAFTQLLEEDEIPVVAPIPDASGLTLHHYEDHRFALYPRRGGRTPELDDPEQLEMIGRFIARIHLHGQLHPFKHRPTLDIESFGEKPSRYLLENGFIPAELETSYASLVDDLLLRVRRCFEAAGDFTTIRLHGDCHPSNILWRDGTPHIVDFDDARMGPAIQDLWMFLSGDRQYATARLADLLEGYTQFRDFDPRELHLIEALRTLRMIHYAGWLARRAEDPAFKLAFTWFYTPRYWDDHILALREQASLMDEPPLVWD
jgi:Ser/Thr protein kinase RdoA (MazF antagonist)